MPRPLLVCRHGLTLAAAVVLLSACGGSGDDEQAAATSATSSSAARSSADAAGSEFCTEAARALGSVAPAFSGQGEDPAALAPALRDAANQVRAIEPPGEIAPDWTALADGIEEFAQAFAEVDAADPASESALQQRAGEIIGRLSTSATTVQTYLSEECGLQTPPQPAAPTS
jgi:hypothetical protein